ncbi:MAG: GNAT family N-acetyltransferase [Planctomycetota bacterium]
MGALRIWEISDMDYTQVITDVQIRQTAKLAGEIWTEHFTPIIGAEQVEYMLDKIQSEDAITDQIRNRGYVYYLIGEAEQPIGYFAIVQEEAGLFLSKLYILKTMRGKGIARKTIDFLKTIALERGLDKIWLTVNKNNIGPIAAYEKLGFVNTGPLVQDIGGGFIMDDYRMELKL